MIFVAQHDPKPTRSVGLAKPSTVGVVIQMVTVLLAVLVGVLPSSATAGAPAFTYDIPTTARVDTHDFNAAGTSPAQVRGAREESAPLLVDAQGTSTTLIAPVVATNTANDVLRFGTKDSWGNLNTLDDHFARHGADLRG